MSTLTVDTAEMKAAGVIPERVAAYWEARGRVIAWGTPTPGGTANPAQHVPGARTRVCPKCGNAVSLHESTWARHYNRTGRIGTWHAACLACETEGGTGSRKRCRKCLASKPISHFGLTPKGKRRTQYCTACCQEALEATERACKTCGVLTPVEQIVAATRTSVGAPICRTCHNEQASEYTRQRRVAARKAARELTG